MLKKASRLPEKSKLERFEGSRIQGFKSLFSKISIHPRIFFLLFPRPREPWAPWTLFIQVRFHLFHQFFDIKRFGDILIRSGFLPKQFIFFLSLGSQHQDGYVLVLLVELQ